MTKNSADLLSGIYKVTPNKVYIIHHGVPAFTARDRKMLKQEYGFAGQGPGSLQLHYHTIAGGYSWIDP
jgi:hypothetical protein